MSELGWTRRDAIRRHLGLWGSARTSELRARFEVSERTIQRDFNAIVADSADITRVHGGLVASGDPDRARLRVGLLVPNPDYYFDDVLRGAQDTAERLNVRLVTAEHKYQDDLERLLLERLGEVRLDGLVVTVDHDEDRHRFLARQGLPTVIIERPWCPELRNVDHVAGVGGYLDHVFSDHVAGAALGLQHLVDLEHRSIRCLFRNTPTTSALARGVRDAADHLIALGVTVETWLLPMGAQRRDETWCTAIDEVVSACLSDGVTAVMAHSDPVAEDLVDRLRAAGLAVPDRVSVVTYDGSRTATELGLSAVSPRRRAVGAVAVERIVDRLRQGGRRGSTGQPGFRISLVPEFVAGRTTGPAPGFMA
ncbi:substrate-binding domain-containing protein [Microlunatus sp. Y2014]|uniref:substrate-binding domain-containing protein n=1 Tax=Microlunatus sp. Y2014 TaxID=3418488 RepID=UPI003DA7A69D